jgi:hypothetical protein
VGGTYIRIDHPPQVAWHDGHYSQANFTSRDDHVVSGEGHPSPVCNLCSRVWTSTHTPSPTFSKCDTFFTSSIFYNKGLETSVCRYHSGEDKRRPRCVICAQNGDEDTQGVGGVSKRKLAQKH